MTSGGGVGAAVAGGAKAAAVPLRLHHYLVMAGVAAAVVLACLRYAPDAGFLAVAPPVVEAAAVARAEADAGAGRDDPPPARPSSSVVIFNFGDSNSDTGGMAAVNGMNLNLPEGRTFFRRPTGRLSDGRLVIDFICESLHTPYLSPYLKALGADFSNGVNFAIGGSTATPGGSPFSLDVQLHQWLYFRARSMEMINLGQKPPIDREGFRKAIYTIDIGQNDVSAYMHLPYDQVLAKIPGFVAQIKYTIETLYSHGARKFWIHGTGALGCLPQKLAIPRDDDTDLDAHGCLNPYNAAAKRFNALLREACSQLRRRMVDAALVFVDMYTIKDREASDGVLRLRRAALQLQPLQGVHVGGDAAVRRGHALRQLGRRAPHRGRQCHRRRQGAHRRLLHAQGHHRQTRQLHAAQRRLACCADRED